MPHQEEYSFVYTVQSIFATINIIFYIIFRRANILLVRSLKYGNSLIPFDLAFQIDTEELYCNECRDYIIFENDQIIYTYFPTLCIHSRKRKRFLQQSQNKKLKLYDNPEKLFKFVEHSAYFGTAFYDHQFTYQLFFWLFQDLEV